MKDSILFLEANISVLAQSKSEEYPALEMRVVNKKADLKQPKYNTSYLTKIYLPEHNSIINHTKTKSLSLHSFEICQRGKGLRNRGETNGVKFTSKGEISLLKNGCKTFPLSAAFNLKHALKQCHVTFKMFCS